MKKIALDGRLRSAAELVRQGAVLADIGTDHAYLPLFLLSEGRLCRAICADIAEGPLQSARKHAEDTPYGGQISFVQTDGLLGLDAEGITDITICGMGGELIVSILERAAFVRDPSLRLILQPMTKQEILRDYLLRSGFEITDEVYSSSEGKFYLTLAAQYTGSSRVPSLTEAHFGMPDRAVGNSKEFLGYLDGKRRALIRAMNGKRAGEQSVQDEEELLRWIEDFTKQKI